MDSVPHHASDNNLPREKRCTRCKKPFPATPEFFQRNRAVKGGLRPDCKNCREAIRNTPEARERIKAYNQTYFSTPEIHERVRAHEKARYHADPQRRQHIKDYNNRPEMREYRRTYLKDYNKRPEIKERDREARRIAKKNRRAHEKNISGSYTEAQIQTLLKRQKCRCYYAACGHAEFEKRNGKYVYHIDHTFPINRVAGTDIPANDISYLVLACPACNHRKSDKFPWEFPEGGRLL